MARTPRTSTKVTPAEPPDTRSLPTLRAAAAGCTACPLHRTGTQTVFGAGPRTARVLFVGEQPGDQEDKKGLPFVGPAGALLDRALEEAGIARGQVYVTNAVKHFKWEPVGGRRIHAKPNAREVQACKPWLGAELRAVHPDVIVCLGATAAQALLGRSFRVTRSRGEPQRSPTPYARVVIATVHPSSILRAPDAAARAQAYDAFVDDLRVVRRLLDRRTSLELEGSAAHAP